MHVADWKDIGLAEAEAKIEALTAQVAELREERDALLRRPINLAEMDSEDEEITTQMIAYYWHEQAMIARAALAKQEQSDG
jgi:hypothetical protein